MIFLQEFERESLDEIQGNFWRNPRKFFFKAQNGLAGEILIVSHVEIFLVVTLEHMEEFLMEFLEEF